MGIKDNFTQAMKELTNPRPSDARKEVRDVASYMNDTADAQPTGTCTACTEYSAVREQTARTADTAERKARNSRQRLYTAGADTGFFAEDSP